MSKESWDQESRLAGVRKLLQREETLWILQQVTYAMSDLRGVCCRLQLRTLECLWQSALLSQVDTGVSPTTAKVWQAEWGNRAAAFRRAVLSTKWKVTVKHQRNRETILGVMNNNDGGSLNCIWCLRCFCWHPVCFQGRIDSKTLQNRICHFCFHSSVFYSEWPYWETVTGVIHAS